MDPNLMVLIDKHGNYMNLVEDYALLDEVAKREAEHLMECLKVMLLVNEEEVDQGN